MNHYQFFNKGGENREEIQCKMCLEDAQCPVGKLCCCDHVFCRDCIVRLSEVGAWITVCYCLRCIAANSSHENHNANNLPQEKAVSYSLCCVSPNSSHKHPDANKLRQEKASCPYDRKEFTTIDFLEHREGAPVEMVPVEKALESDYSLQLLIQQAEEIAFGPFDPSQLSFLQGEEEIDLTHAVERFDPSQLFFQQSEEGIDLFQAIDSVDRLMQLYLSVFQVQHLESDDSL